ncbi:MAG: hypothetical protein ABSE82_06635 [Nitrososphaerales archaeon]
MTLNWEPLSSGDPLPGDPVAIQQLSSLLGSYATECSSSATKLQNLGNIDWQSDAATAFRLRKEAFVPKLALVSQRLSSSSTILWQFAAQVSSYQSSGQDLRANAQLLLNEIQAIEPLVAEQQSYNERQNLEALVGKPPVPWSGPDYEAQEAELQASYNKVKTSFAEVVSDYGVTTQTCTSELQQVSHDALANNLFSVFSHYLGDASSLKSDLGAFDSIIRDGMHEINYLLPGTARLLHDIANIAGIIAILPIPGLQEAAELVFLGASAGALVVDVALKAEHRDGVTWGTLGMDVFQVASAGVLNKANNMVNIAEGAGDGESGAMSWIVSANPNPDLETSSSYLENFPARLNIESKTLNILGQADSAGSWLNQNSQFVNQTWGTIKASLSSSPLLLSIPYFTYG